MLRLIVFLVLSPCVTLAQNESPKGVQKPLEFINLFSTAMKEGVSCYRIPALLTTSNGDLIAAIDERIPNCGDLRTNNDIDIVIRRSKDNGKTWSNIQTIVDYPDGESASDPSMILDEITGELFLFFNYMNLETEKDIYYLKVISSTDNGLNWSAPTDITAQITKPEWQKDFKFITSGRGIQAKSGTLWHTLVNIESGLHLFKSDDHGKSWVLIDTPIKPGDESKVLELSDGSLMINSRVNKLGMRYVHTSRDHGKTWSSKQEAQLPDPACNASIIRYTHGSDKSRILFSNANSKKERENLTVKISYDDGITWSKGKTIYAGPSAYSSMTVLKNGNIGVFFEKDKYAENVFVSFSLAWLTYGKEEI